MQRPTVFEGIVVALAISVITSPLGYVASLWSGAPMGGKLCLVSMAYAYMIYLLAKSPKDRKSVV